MAYRSHKEQSRDVPVRCAVVTVSDTRTTETDKSGPVCRDALSAHGHEVVEYRIVRDEPVEIESCLDDLLDKCDVVIFNGGTGISDRDTTIEVVSRRLEKQLPGFGELFRMLSYDDIGAGAMLSRATAGVAGDTLVFSIPGSTGAVTLAMDTLIAPELSHLVWEIFRHRKTASR